MRSAASWRGSSSCTRRASSPASPSGRGADGAASSELEELTQLSRDLHLGTGEQILRGDRRFRLLPFLGPAFVACVAYIDPGNFATNIAGGSQFGYTLVWVIVASNLMAMLIQTLSAKLGIATGRNLPEVCRERFSRRTSIVLWVQAEAIAMATDLAEFLGAAIGFHLLLRRRALPGRGDHGRRRVRDPRPAALRLPAARGGDRGVRRRDRRSATCASSGSRTRRSAPSPGTRSCRISTAPSRVLLAVGILGATVMPHVIYLHSALMQNRIVPRNDKEAGRLFRFTRIDVVIAMTIAGVINMAMLVDGRARLLRERSARRRLARGRAQHARAAARRRLEHALRARPARSGLSSSAVGTLAGQVVMQGFIRRQIPLFVRRAVTMLPAFVVIAHRRRPLTDARDEPGRALVRDPLRARAAGDVHAPTAT